MKGACESRPRASVGQLGTGTSDPSPMLLCGISQCFQNMRSLVGCISGKEGRLGGVEGGGSGVWPEAAAVSSACLSIAIPHRSGPFSLCSALTVTLEGAVRRPLPPPTCLLVSNIPV